MNTPRDPPGNPLIGLIVWVWDFIRYWVRRFIVLLTWLWRLDWWYALFGDRSKPSPLASFTARSADMDKDVLLEWTYGPIDPATNQKPIASVQIEAKPALAEESAWAILESVAFPKLTYLHKNPEPGEWDYRATPVDTAGTLCPTPSLASYVVEEPVAAPPSPLATFTASGAPVPTPVARKK